MNMKTSKEYYDHFTNELSVLSNDEIIERFNGAVGIASFGISRQGYLWALRNQIENRGIDFSEIGNNEFMSYANKVELINNRMIKRIY